MNKIFTIILIFCALIANAQLTGSRNVPSDNYSGIAVVVDSLNTQGVGTSGITFVFADDAVFAQTAPVILTATGTLENPISFVRSNTGTEKPKLYFIGTAATSEACIQFSGSDYVTIDGLFISDTTITTEYGLYFLSNGTNGCQYNMVKNSTISLRKLDATTNYGVYLNSTPTVVSGANSFNLFYNNVVENCYIGYYLSCTTSDISMFDEANEVGNQASGTSLIQNLSMCGVYAYGQKGVRIFNNHIVNLVRTGTGNTAPAAISTNSDTPSASNNLITEISGNVIEGVSSSFTSVFGIYISSRNLSHNIFNNSVSGIYASGTSNFGATGINILGTNIIANIYNNYIFDVKSPLGATGTSTPASRGIYIGLASNVNLWYNTVVLDYQSTDANHQSAAVYVKSSTPTLDFRNNIFVNNTTFPAGGTGRSVAFYNSTNTLTMLSATADNNLYYVGTPTSKHLIFFGYSSSAPVADSTLEQYKLRAETREQHSVTENPTFMSATNLHINHLVSSVIAEGGTPITVPMNINTDFDGDARNTTLPDIGADELDGAWFSTVTFTVTNNNLPIVNASVSFNNTTLFTDNDGNAVFAHISLGSQQAVTINQTNYEPYTDAIDITQLSHLFPISLTVVGVASVENNQQYKVYPNPAENFICIDGNFLDTKKVELYSINGQYIMNCYLSGNSFTNRVSLQSLQTGFYILKIVSENNIQQYKIFKK